LVKKGEIKLVLSKIHGNFTRSNKMRVSEFIKKHVKPLLCVAGLGIGFINGFFGGGGGMLCVPVLAGIAGLSTKQSHATALAVMLPLSLFSLHCYAQAAPLCDLQFFAVFFPSLAGGAVGAWLLGRLSVVVLNRIFATVMALSGILLLF
jgi:uncharacterized membrane protein YfcA